MAAAHDESVALVTSEPDELRCCYLITNGETVDGSRGEKVFTLRHKSLKMGLNFKHASFYETLSWSKLVIIHIHAAI